MKRKSVKTETCIVCGLTYIPNKSNTLDGKLSVCDIFSTKDSNKTTTTRKSGKTATSFDTNQETFDAVSQKRLQEVPILKNGNSEELEVNFLSNFLLYKTS